MKEKLLIGIQEKPQSYGQWFILALQHVFAMFGATVLVPALTGLPVSVALVASGIGTLIYIGFTRGKVPVYLGSSFAYIAAISYTNKTYGLGAVMTGLVVVGLIYVLVALVIKFTGKEWLKKVLPARVIGPMIMIIGLTLVPVAMQNSNFIFGFIYFDGVPNTGGAGDVIWQSLGGNISLLVALATLATALLVNKFASGFAKVIPILIAIGGGVLIAYMAGEYAPTSETFGSFFRLPEFKMFWNTGFDFRAVGLFAPLALVTIAEHIGDHTVLGQICEEDFLQEPGLDNTLLGDGVATAISGMIGGPANTTYGENTGVVALTKVGSVWVTGTAAVFAILLGFVGVVSDFLNSIPGPVMGGISLILFGLISFNGYKVLKTKVRWNWQAIVVVVLTLYVGLSDVVSKFVVWFPVTKIQFTESFALGGMALAVIVGILVSFGLSFTESAPDEATE